MPHPTSAGRTPIMDDGDLSDLDPDDETTGPWIVVVLDR